MGKVFCLAGGFLALMLFCGPASGGGLAAGGPAQRPAGLMIECPAESFIASGAAQEEEPLLLSAKKKKKKKKGKEEASLGEGGVRIDPNTAGLKRLTVLPLVDEKTARAIIENRPYGKPEDLIKVPGVGVARYRIFRHLIEIRGAGEAVVEEEEEIVVE